jgi:hypothetical protein
MLKLRLIKYQMLIKKGKTIKRQIKDDKILSCPPKVIFISHLKRARLP